jgi:hypothetical protein
MRKEMTVLPTEGDPQAEASVNAEGSPVEPSSMEPTAEPASESAPEATAPASTPTAPPPAASPAGNGSASLTTRLTALMALPEPARTDELEKAVNGGLTVYLRSKTGAEVRVRYGEHILTVPAQPKPFTTPHAIHLLFVASDRLEEVEE